ncbi:MAG: SUMF1/EgtB/PvdO family nonheme iron enzyme [Candidatus Aminicenantes bacterium]|nr:SUMF1/EgtB/PvdO family nonheme iron enzyme [Candidatus Aminicenantes bacterium]
MEFKIISKRLLLLGLAVLFSLLSVVMAAAPQGNQQDISFSSSYALVIGIDNYKNDKDWPSKGKAVSDAILVGNELEKLGFDVTYRIALDLKELENNLRKFFNSVKIDNKSRLFIWYSGHAHTIDGESFLVPADAPPEKDKNFKTKAFPVRRFDEFSRITKAKHVYMVFDSCFSSMVFIKESRDSQALKIPVASMLRYPVRQYLCSCTDKQGKQKYPSFQEMFIKALRNEEKADGNEDNYLTAGEIASFIKDNGKNQKLQYGKLKLKGVKEGEFVFLVKSFFKDPLSVGGEGPEMVKIPGGVFKMGDLQGEGIKDEKPVHEVNVVSIAVGLYEVTFKEYDRFCEATGYSKPDANKWKRGNRPVINVSWEDAVAYTDWLTKQTGNTYRLPTEAEWEYFARAGTGTNYWWGNEIGVGNACCHGCGARWSWDGEEKKTAPVESFNSNPFDIYDTVGNVWEWTCSEYTDDYNKETNRLYKKDITDWKDVVIRGGAWDEKPNNCRVSRRRGCKPFETSSSIGFRVVIQLEKEDK